MKAEEIIDFFAPHPSSTDIVTAWLQMSGISSERIGISTNRQVCIFLTDTIGLNRG